MDLDNYRAILVRDIGDYDTIYEVILLNYKHTVEEFQNEINRIRNEHKEEIQLYGNDWEIIKANLDNKFDWVELNSNLIDFIQI